MPLFPGMLGITFPNGRKNFFGAPQLNTWYATSLANSITGVELNAGESDIDIYLNQTVSWYFDTTGTVPAGQYDFVSVAMHELGHGFGFVSLAKKSGSEGSFGMLEASDFAPLVSSFPWPDLDTLPGAFDRFLVNNSNVALLDLSNPSNALGSALSNNNVYFNGANAVAANGGVKPRVFAPASFELGSSISHLNEATFPTGNANEMMTPSGAPGNANHNPGPIAIGALMDIGWNINPALSVNNLLEQEFLIYPNPTVNALVVNCKNEIAEKQTLKIIDVTGRIVFATANFSCNELINVSTLLTGCYNVVIETKTSVRRSRFVKL